MMKPLLQGNGVVYRKKKNVFARRAHAGELIQTQTADGLETVNTAGEGDYIVRNQTNAREEYIVPAYKFIRKYKHLWPTDAQWAEYEPLGHIVAVELTPQRLETLTLPAEFEFTAPWGAPMTAKTGDFIGCPPDYSEVYRLARTEFFETYIEASGADAS